MYFFQLNLPTLSLFSVLNDLWQGLCGFFDMIGSLVSMVFSLIESIIVGMGQVIAYLVTLLPMTSYVNSLMPAAIFAAASVTLVIFLLRFLFGAFIG